MTFGGSVVQHPRGKAKRAYTEYSTPAAGKDTAPQQTHGLIHWFFKFANRLFFEFTLDCVAFVISEECLHEAYPALPPTQSVEPSQSLCAPKLHSHVPEFVCFSPRAPFSASLTPCPCNR